MFVISLFICILQSGVFYHWVFSDWSVRSRLTLALLTSLHIQLLFISLSYFLALSYELKMVSASYFEILILVVFNLILSFTIFKLKNDQNVFLKLSKPIFVHGQNVSVDWLCEPKIGLYLRRLAFISVIAILVFSLSQFAAQPHGEWDAWAIWNLKARFLFRQPDDWLVGFGASTVWSHPDYPLMLPLIVARIWGYLGKELLLVPHVLALFYLFSGLFVVYALLKRFSHQNVAYLGVLLLATSYSYVKNSLFLTADIPLANILLISVCFFVGFIYSQRISLLVLAWLFLASLMWMKNEGQLIYLVFSFTYLLIAVRQYSLFKTILIALIVTAPVLVTYFVFMQQITIENDLFAATSIDSLFKNLVDFERYKVIIFAIIDVIIDVFKVSLLFVLLWLAVSCTQIFQSKCKYLLFSCLICLLGYFSIYLFVTPHDLQWHLNTSIERISLHFYPSIVLLLLLSGLKIKSEPVVITAG